MEIAARVTVVSAVKRRQRERGMAAPQEGDVIARYMYVEDSVTAMRRRRILPSFGQSKLRQPFIIQFNYIEIQTVPMQPSPFHPNPTTFPSAQTHHPSLHFRMPYLQLISVSLSIILLQQQTMKSELQYNRKIFSHSIKQIQPLFPHSNPETPSRSLLSPTKEKQLMKAPRRRSRVELVRSNQQHKSYEKMVDEIMKKHVEEHNLPLLKTKLFIKHQYKNYRITNSEKRDQREGENKMLEMIGEDQQLNGSPAVSSVHKKKERGSVRLRSQIFQSLAEAEEKTPLPAKQKRMPLQLPLILKYDRDTLGSCKVGNSSLLSQKSVSSSFEDGFEEMKKKFIKKYVKAYTEN